VALSVISQPTSATAELNVTTKIHKYRGLQERHHFILMAMEVHDTPRHDMDHFIKKCACHFQDTRSRNHLSLSFCIQFFKHVTIALQHALASTIERKIALIDYACSKPLVIIKSHNLHAGDIKRAMGEIASFQERD